MTASTEADAADALASLSLGAPASSEAGPSTRRKREPAPGDLESAVRRLEQALLSTLRQHGPDAREVLDACEELTLAYNALAMRLLDRRDYDEALELLKKAEVLTDKNSEVGAGRRGDSIARLRAVTYNNLGCFFKRKKNPHAAIRYLEKAVAIEELIASRAENPAGTHLNLCCVLSECGQHDSALAHAADALRLLHAQIGLGPSPTAKLVTARLEGEGSAASVPPQSRRLAW